MIQKFLFMITNPKKTCLVLDLDDTLYKEYDYQTSGLKYVEEQVLELYNVDLRGNLLELRDQGVNDIFLELTNILNIPSSIKDSFLMMYRYHKPNIALTLGTKKFIELALHNFGQVVILTDGRSISQRLKLESLNLLEIPVFISEEWNSTKPDKKRFVAIMDRYAACSEFCYVADNPSKDFIAPNALGWKTIGVRDSGKNIHIQMSNLSEKYKPDRWLSNLKEIVNFGKNNERDS
jgi:putative hydrolase of the HAD superfamily